MAIAQPEQVRHFLVSMKLAVASDRWQLVRRDKNLEDLERLGMTHSDVVCVLQGMTVDDYCDGPLPDDKGRPKEWWVFGPVYAGETLYVKMCLNRFGTVECLSFHLAQTPMTYPLRGGGLS